MFQVDDLKFTISFEMWLKISWVDNRIKIKAANSNNSVTYSTSNITLIALENSDILNHIWVPQVAIPHQKLYKSVPGPPLTDSLVNVVSREQTVWVDIWSTVKPTITCPMSFNWFPFDKQTCNLILRVRSIMLTIIWTKLFLVNFNLFVSNGSLILKAILYSNHKYQTLWKW